MSGGLSGLGGLSPLYGCEDQVLGDRQELSLFEGESTTQRETFSEWGAHTLRGQRPGTAEQESALWVPSPHTASADEVDCWQILYPRPLPHAAHTGTG